MKNCKRSPFPLPLRILAVWILLAQSSCSTGQPAPEGTAGQPIFPKGREAPKEYFTGTAHVHGLVENDSIYSMVAGSVTFEAGARSNWHAHPAGQILIVTAGVGHHQIKGQPRETIRKGDVVQCPPNTVHWHGASADSSMTHIYILPNTEKGIVEWMEAVTDAEYAD